MRRLRHAWLTAGTLAARTATSCLTGPRRPHRLTDIAVGTNAGHHAYSVARTRAANDHHGLGAFLIMNEQPRARPRTSTIPREQP